MVSLNLFWLQGMKLSFDVFVGAVMKDLAKDKFEIGFGMSEGHLMASREEPDSIFQQMNSRW